MYSRKQNMGGHCDCQASVVVKSLINRHNIFGQKCFTCIYLYMYVGMHCPHVWSFIYFSWVSYHTLYHSQSLHLEQSFSVWHTHFPLRKHISSPPVSTAMKVQCNYSTHTPIFPFLFLGGWSNYCQVQLCTRDVCPNFSATWSPVQS